MERIRWSTTQSGFLKGHVLIAVGVDARHQRFPDEPRYVYQPMVGMEDEESVERNDQGKIS